MNRNIINGQPQASSILAFFVYWKSTTKATINSYTNIGHPNVQYMLIINLQHQLELANFWLCFCLFKISNNNNNNNDQTSNLAFIYSAAERILWLKENRKKTWSGFSPIFRRKRHEPTRLIPNFYPCVVSRPGPILQIQGSISPTL